MTHSRTMRANLALVALFFGAVGCAVPETTDSSQEKEPDKVTVPLKKTDPDTAYVVEDSALVSNETYSEGTLGSITVTAKLLEEICQGHDPLKGCQGGYDWHYLSAKLLLKDGASLECAEFDEHNWSEVGTFEEIDVRCDEKLKLSDVKSVVLVKQEPLSFY